MVRSRLQREVWLCRSYVRRLTNIMNIRSERVSELMSVVSELMSVVSELMSVASQRSHI
jgi:hypothetical protein